MASTGRKLKGRQHVSFSIAGAILILSILTSLRLAGCGPLAAGSAAVDYAPLPEKDWKVSTPEEQGLFALQLVKVAAEQIMPHYYSCVVNMKPDGTDVTEADRRAEEVVREMIAKRLPDHSILGEEFGATSGSRTQYRWVVDPLDGTTWFALGVPIFGTLVALLEDDEPLIGVTHFPVTGETVYAGKGLGCWFKVGDTTPVRVRVGSKVGLKDAVVSAAGVHSSNIHT